MIRQSLILIVFLMFTSVEALASCDPCITASAVAAGEAQVGAIGATTAAVESANSAITFKIEQSTNSLLNGLDASTKILQAEMEKSMQLQTRLTDSRMQNLTTTLKAVVDSNTAIQSDRTFGPQSMPKSGDIGAERATGLLQAEQSRIALIRQLQEDFYKWMNDPEGNQTGARGVKANTLLKEKPEMWDPSPMLTKNVMSDEESKNAQKLIIGLVNYMPDRPLTQEEIASGADMADKELKRRVANARDMVAHDVLVKRVVDRTALIPYDQATWGNGYVKAESVNGKTSLQEMYRSEIEGRMTSPEWHLDIKTMTDAGLLREQVYLQAIRNKMLLEIMEQENKESLMAALDDK